MGCQQEFSLKAMMNRVQLPAIERLVRCVIVSKNRQVWKAAKPADCKSVTLKHRRFESFPTDQIMAPQFNLVRALPCHGRSYGFEPRRSRHSKTHQQLISFFASGAQGQRCESSPRHQGLFPNQVSSFRVVFQHCGGASMAGQLNQQSVFIKCVLLWGGSSIGRAQA